MQPESLYDRLGGIFAIAAVVDKFSDDIIDDPVAGKDSENPALRDWHRNSLDRLPGLKWMRTLWVATAAGGPYQFLPSDPSIPLDARSFMPRDMMNLTEAHRDLNITFEEFDAVAGVLSRTLDAFNIPETEKNEVLAAFAAHKPEVIEGSTD